MGETGIFDPAQMAFDVPMPTSADESVFDAVQASALVSTPIRMMDDPGSIVPGIELPADQGPIPSPDVTMAPEGDSFMLGELPMVVPETSPGFDGLFSQEGSPDVESPTVFAEAFSSPAVDSPVASEGVSVMLGGLPGVGIPMAPQSPFAGVSMAPEEAFDLQLALSPPEPSQEGFAGASDAPLSAPVGAYASILGEAPSIGHLRQMEALSTQLFGPLGSDASPGGGAGGGRGAGVTIQNLNLPAADASSVIDQLLSMSNGTEADISALGA